MEIKLKQLATPNPQIHCRCNSTNFVVVLAPFGMVPISLLFFCLLVGHHVRTVRSLLRSIHTSSQRKQKWLFLTVVPACRRECHRQRQITLPPESSGNIILLYGSQQHERSESCKIGSTVSIHSKHRGSLNPFKPEKHGRRTPGRGTMTQVLANETVEGRTVKKGTPSFAHWQLSHSTVLCRQN